MSRLPAKMRVRIDKNYPKLHGPAVNKKSKSKKLQKRDQKGREPEKREFMEQRKNVKTKTKN